MKSRMLVPAGTVLLLVHINAVRRAPVLWRGQTCTSRVVENAPEKYG